MTDTQQTTQLTGSNVKLPNGSVLDLASITPRNYTQYDGDFTTAEQQQAASIARFVHNYEQTIELNDTQIEALSGVAINAIPEYFRLLNQGADALRNSTDEGVQLLQNLIAQDPSVQNTIEEIRDNNFVATAENVGAVSRAISGVAGGAMGTVEFLTKLPGAAILLGDTVFDSVGSGYSNAQSEAFGAAYVLAQREATRRGGIPEEVGTRAPNFLDQALSYAQAAWVSIPFLPQVASFIAAGEFSAEGWAQAGERIATENAERAAEAGGTGFAATRQHFLEKNTTTRTSNATTTTALEIMSGAEEIAGVDTAEVTSLLSRGGTYLNQQGMEIEVAPITENATLQETETGRNRWSHLAEKANLNPARIFVQEDGSPNYFGTAGAGLVGYVGYANRARLGEAAATTGRVLGRTGVSLTRSAAALTTGIAQGTIESGARIGQTTRIISETTADAARVNAVATGNASRIADPLARASGALGDDAARAAAAAGEATLATTRFAGVGRVLGRAALPVGVVITGLDGVNMVDALQEGDTRRAVGSGTALGTALAGAAAGAGVGLLGGPFAPVTSTAGAIVGFAAGGIAAIFTKPMAEKAYDRYSGTPETINAETAQTVTGQTEAQRLEQARLQAEGVDLGDQGVTTAGASSSRMPVLPNGQSFSTARLATI